ncbi:restriction endonuclease subunit S [Phascolarctobacterium faecium]
MAWEQRKLGNFGKTYTGLSGKTKDDFGHGKAQFITYMNVYSNPIIDVEMTEPIEIDLKQNEVEIGDVFFTTSSETPEEVGMSSVLLKKCGTVYLNSFCFGFRPFIILDNYFLAYMLRAQVTRKQIILLAQGISRYNISKNKVMEINIFVPHDKEQQQLGKFFYKLDNLITLHQRKLDKMKELKKAFLNLIFSQKLRFRGFTESWELRKLKDITYPAGEKNRENLPLDSYSITNEHGFIPQDERFENGGTMRETDKKMYYIVSPHSFAYNPARINIGSIGYQNTDKNVIVSSLYEVFKTSDDVDDRLLWYWFKSSYFQKLIEQFQEGGVRLYFYYDKLCMGTLSLPSFEEQHKIGKYLDTYDNLITLRQEKINQLTKLKTTFLKNMFL